MEMIWSPYRQADEKIYLLLLLRFCDAHPPLCTCLCHIPGQHRGRTTGHLPLSCRKPRELTLASINPNGYAIPPLYGTPKLSPNPSGCLCSKKGFKSLLECRTDKQECCRMEDATKDSGRDAGKDVWAEGPGLHLTTLPPASRVPWQPLRMMHTCSNSVQIQEQGVLAAETFRKFLST